MGLAAAAATRHPHCPAAPGWLLAGTAQARLVGPARCLAAGWLQWASSWLKGRPRGAAQGRSSKHLPAQGLAWCPAPVEAAGRWHAGERRTPQAPAVAQRPDPAAETAPVCGRDQEVPALLAAGLGAR